MARKKQSLVAVITARGGSKRLPGKNLRKLLGKPLIAYIIQAAIESRSIDRVIVSTDTRKIADAARNYGAEVPFYRPGSLAQDETPSMPVVKHALEYLIEEEGSRFDAVIILQPTSPLVLAKDFDKAWKMFQARKARVVSCLSPVPGHPEWYYSLTESRRMRPLIDADKARRLRSQELPQYYTLNGAFTIRRVADILGGKTDLQTGVYGFVIPDKRSVDIDTMADFKLAEEMMILRRETGR